MLLPIMAAVSTCTAEKTANQVTSGNVLAKEEPVIAEGLEAVNIPDEPLARSSTPGEARVTDLDATPPWPAGR
jgi:hypothetical protein